MDSEVLTLFNIVQSVLICLIVIPLVNVAYRILFRPDQPKDLTADWQDSQVIVTWNTCDRADLFKVHYRSTDLGATKWDLVCIPNANTCSLTIMNGLTYEICVVAENSFRSSLCSHITTGRFRVPSPKNLTASYEPTGGFVNLQWAPVVNGRGYVVKRSSDFNHGVFSTVTLINNPSVTVAQDSSFEFGVKYRYIVLSLDHGGESASSNESFVDHRAPAPTNLVALLDSDNNHSLSLQWLSVPKTVGYVVKRATGSLSTLFVTIRILNDPSINQFFDASFKFGVTYYYIVTSIDRSGESKDSHIVSSYYRAPIVKDFAGSYESAGIFINLQWTPLINGKGYSIKRARDASSAAWLTVESINDPSIKKFKDTSFIFGTEYYYTITSIDEAGESISSKPIAVVAPRAPAPTDLITSYAESASDHITLQWEPVVNGKGYVVKRMINVSSSGIVGR
jgi:large repetitive protein